MSEFIVHSIPGSPFGRAVLTALEEKGARYSFSPLAPGGLRSPEHLARHPFGRVPVLEHDGFLLYETQAILRYLDRVLPNPPLTPADPARRADGSGDEYWYLFQASPRHRAVAWWGRGCWALRPTRPRSKPRCRRRARYSMSSRG
jgi:glutathione S-transferase